MERSLLEIGTGSGVGVAMAVGLVLGGKEGLLRLEMG